jgi:hypothetical protein
MRKLAAIFLLISASCLMADEVKPERLPNPIREMSFVERMDMQQKRAEREKEGKKEDPKALSKHMDFDYTTHMGAFHHPLHISHLGESITIHDGSIWSVHHSDRFKTYNWLTTDSLKITPNHAWFSTYQYRFTNLNTSESVQVNLIDNPVFNGIYTHWIIAIDISNGQICLEDGTVWNLNGFDFAIYKKWLPNDTVIIGTNDGMWSSSKPNILINCNIVGTPYVEARCIN